MDVDNLTWTKAEEKTRLIWATKVARYTITVTYKPVTDTWHGSITYNGNPPTSTTPDIKSAFDRTSADKNELKRMLNYHLTKMFNPTWP